MALGQRSQPPSGDGAQRAERALRAADRRRSISEAVGSALARGSVSGSFEVIDLSRDRRILVVTVRAPVILSLKATLLVEGAIAEAIAPEVINEYFWRAAPPVSAAREAPAPAPATVVRRSSELEDIHVGEGSFEEFNRLSNAQQQGA